jgi:UPF0271 protein
MDLNADLGESYGHWTLGDDERLVPHLTSANLACGFHAGDFRVMEATVALCRRAGVAVGAQPGYPDLLGFGRRPMPFEPDEVESIVRYQIGALEAFCRAHGVEMQHVKPHGALYNMAARDEGLAATIADTVKAFDPDLILLGLAGSALVTAAQTAGLRTAGEGFADRGYRPDGSLIPRGQSGAVIDDPSEVVAQALRLVRRSAAPLPGAPPRIDSLCIHGDTPGAASLAALLRSALIDAGVAVESLGSAAR